MALVIKNPPANEGDLRDTDFPGLARSPAGGQSNPLQDSYLEGSMDGTWWAIVHGVTESDKTGAA